MRHDTNDLADLGPTDWACPRCGAKLKTVEYEYAIVETCPQCAGEWCDRMELLQITKTLEQQFTPEEIALVRGIDDIVITPYSEMRDELSCPKCENSRLQAFVYATTSGLILDKCPTCEGIWCDRNELEHAQILVEQWEHRLEEDIETFGELLQKLREEFANALGDAWLSETWLRFTWLNALMRWYERMTL